MTKLHSDPRLWVVIVSSLVFAMIRVMVVPLVSAKVKAFATLSTFGELLFSNTVVSIVHSALSSLLAFTALVTSHSLHGDYVNSVTRFEFLATGVSTGYFAYDLWDYVLNGLYAKSPGIILHHVVVLICYISALTKTVGVPLLSFALVCELHSVFMHARKLLTMSNYSVEQSATLCWGGSNLVAMTMKGAKTDVDWFSPEELATAREEYLEEQEKEQPSPQVKLRYAIALAKSRKRDDKYRAIGLLEDLLEQGYAPKESLYWISLTLCGLGEYRASRSYCERLLRMEPSHMKAQLLHKRIKDVVAKGVFQHST
ncbi:hypothetical protein BBO99_00000875 [Phytophthora kernoviae]|uniref:TLC domain-containing protein n=2 Tax=Phytophthora kernoviae TaxID=325452 RepID=A0A3R7MVP1_9STRA|nr:hypothetical protein G195_001532 [Phytophthora kernoviae 00238/432]KAG2531825.1 hypothetical protein JM16_000700 [Phytophthora kernoviae]KAG2532689.1 hypothetical protein JM18_000782 [Phytophthora kernoviae]RLN44422.1 hypothetical protein BBI17_000944 [Phytophthora kernoviae]RLN85048.1 hypothetical protein BBO99_00000875 [Phytophthora kernoviae]